MIEIRSPELLEIPQLVDIALNFFHESNYFGDLTPSPVNFAGFCAECVMDPSLEILTLFEDGKAAGISIFNYHKYLTEETISSFYLFFVDRAYRGRGFGRDLLAKSLEIGIHKGARRFYGDAGASFSDGGRNDKVIENLFAKYGFIRLGAMMMKGVAP